VETGSPERVNKADRIAYVVEQWNIPERYVLYVGDFPSDIKVSRQAGVVPVCAAWAPTADPVDLARHEPEFLFEGTFKFLLWLAFYLSRDNEQK
jgi:phosphoglycolate phosphatase-like HAD superfamily hydrolase